MITIGRDYIRFFFIFIFFIFNVYIQPYGYDRPSTLLYFTFTIMPGLLTLFLITISALPRHPHYIVGIRPLGLFALLLLSLLLRVRYPVVLPLLGLRVAPTPLPYPLLPLDPLPLPP